MRVLVPVAFMSVSAASCCCCSGDLLDQLEEQVAAIQGEEPAAAGLPDASGAPAGAAVTGGLCGSFKDEQVQLPAGFQVSLCSGMGSAQSLVAEGSGDLGAACSGMAAWATGRGYREVTKADLGGSISIIMEKGPNRLTIACADVTGKPTISLGLVPK